MSHKKEMLVAAVHASLHPQEVAARHRPQLIGLVLMITGSSIAVFVSPLPLGAGLHVTADIVAYFLHGLGAVPFAYHIVHRLALEPKPARKPRKPRHPKHKMPAELAD